MKEFGKLPLSEGIKLLKPIAEYYGLNLNRAKDLKTARILFAIKNYSSI